jgi:MYXO-CTERM domain-containing protein
MNKAGSYADLKIMLGHFVIDVTSYLGTGTNLQLQFLATYTIKIGGTVQQQNRTTYGSPTQSSSAVPLVFDFMPVALPTPGAVALIGVAGAFFGRRRKA